MEREVRVRFAPSPTGALHIGGVRTALYNYLFARQHGGKMLLRIEDTDQKRFVPGAEDYILQSLKWAGIEIDEGQGVGGPYAPYRQSERTDIYQQYALELISKGLAYYAFDTDEELDAMRKRLEAAKVVSPQYNSITRMQMRNSLTLPDDEVKELLAKKTPYTVRIKIPRKEEIRFHDIIRGWMVVHSSTIDDKVLIKSNGIPTYHMANVVDDHLMNISHVIRGEEWLPSAPLHILLYKYFGWEDSMPQFAHLPLLLKPDGNGKLSKRDADAMGFPIFPLEWNGTNADGEQIVSIGYKEAGFLPEALINFLAFLGWNPGNNQEIFSMEELIQSFSLERVGKAGVKFDINKAKWYNQQYLRMTSDEHWAKFLTAELKNKGIDCDETKAAKIIHLLKERAIFPQDFVTGSDMFFITPDEYDESVINQKWTAEAEKMISLYLEEIKKTDTFDHEVAKQLIHDVLEKNGVKMGKVMQALRVVLTGVGTGPDLMLTMEILGKEETIHRIEKALTELKEKVIA